MMNIFYHGAKYDVFIEDISQTEFGQLQRIREDMIAHFEDFCSGFGAKIDLFDDRKLLHTLLVCPDAESGIYLQYCENSWDSKNGMTYLSLHNASELDETIEILDEMYASKGLFLPIETAWSVMLDFITTGKRSSKITWITPNDIPEGGNW